MYTKSEAKLIKTRIHAQYEDTANMTKEKRLK